MCAWRLLFKRPNIRNRCSKKTDDILAHESGVYSVWPNIRPSTHYLATFFRGVLQPPSHCPRHPSMMLQPRPPPCRQAHLMRSFFRTIPQSGSPGVVAFETGATPPAIKDRPPGAWVWERATRAGGRGGMVVGVGLRGDDPIGWLSQASGGLATPTCSSTGFREEETQKPEGEGGKPKKNRKTNRGEKSRS